MFKQSPFNFFSMLFLVAFACVGEANAVAPQAPGLLLPGAKVASSAPVYKWRAVSRAEIYQLWIIDSSGRRLSKKYRRATICKAGRCKAAPKIALAPGKLRWRVRAKNAYGWGAWSKLRLTTLAPALESAANVLKTGDRYDYVIKGNVGKLWFNDMWRVLHESNARCWISQYNTLNQYQFYQDPSFLPGPLYRYNGFDVSVGQLKVYSIGWYFRPGSIKPLRAVYVNAAIGDFLLVIIDNTTFVEAFWQNSNYLVVTPFHKGNQCL